MIEEPSLPTPITANTPSNFSNLTAINHSTLTSSADFKTTMPDSTLITFTCGHYTITPRTANDSAEDLYSVPTTYHRSSRHHCMACGDEKISLQEFQWRFEAAIQDIRQFFITTTINYLQQGMRYFYIPSKARSSTSSMNLAQSQYGIESRRWNVDPFFAPWMQALKITACIEVKLASGSLDGDAASDICNLINKARWIVSGVVAAQCKLEEDLEQIEDRERMQGFGRKIKSLARDRAIEREESRFGEAEKEAGRLRRRKRAREDAHDEQRRELPVMAIEQARFERWQKRIEGFERVEEMEA